mgnify:CR=1 FL=1
MNKLTSMISRVFFFVAFILAGLAVWEKLANFAGQTLLRGYPPSRLLELAMVVLLFIVALQLREIKLGRTD